MSLFRLHRSLNLPQPKIFRPSNGFRFFVTSKLNSVRRAPTSHILCRRPTNWLMSYNHKSRVGLHFFASRKLRSSESGQTSPSGNVSNKIWTIPNILTMGRMVASPYIGYLIVQGQYQVALGALFVAAFTDWLDGWIAKKYNQGSVLGSFLDPLSDKLLVGITTISLAFKHLISPEVVAIVLGRDLFLMLGTLYLRRKLMASAKPGSSAPTVEIAPNTLSKMNTFLQFSWTGLAVLSAAFGITDLEPVVQYLGYLVAVTTVASGCVYALRHGVKIK
eukprot:TRINITY_DN7356_c0_g1_i2.p1 TRINITY_DN7356_c0_g1~~TRINITY_DN7356_c0_g1_i2.p1  ORF type:complete len:276 (+),score=22.93 TRINITY_DN7356_c0_g1_i2:60-887(+)